MASGPKQAAPSEAQKALSEVAAKRWGRYKTHGVPLVNEAIARKTGYRVDGETGELSVEPGGRLNEDGSIKVDSSQALNANESAQTGALMQLDPNAVGGAVKQELSGGARQGALSAAAMGAEQQANTLMGASNVAAMGKGQQQQTLNSQTQLAGKANNEAINTAYQQTQQRNSNAGAAGTIAGIGAAGLLHHAGKNPYPDEKPN